MNLRYLQQAACIAILTVFTQLIIAFAAPTLAEDSTQFAHYWELRELAAGDSARSYLQSLGAEQGERLAQMTNFLLAQVAADAGDNASVPAYLDLGIPAELREHGAALRAGALEAAGQEGLALNYWRQLANDPASIYTGDALLALATYWRAHGMLDSLVSLPLPAATDDAARSARRQLEWMQALAHADLRHHQDAVNRLWKLASSSPTSDEGKRARRELEVYITQRSFTPRSQSLNEMETELAAYARANAATAGLARIQEWSELPSDKQPQQALTYFRGLFRAQKKEHRDAIATLQDYLRLYPEGKYVAEALAQLGKSAYARGDDSLAIASFERLEHCTGSNDAICSGLESLTIMQMDRGHPALSAGAARRWLSAAEAPGAIADANWRLGWALWESHDFSGAAAAWKSLAQSQDDSEYGPASRYWMARALAKAGQPADARVALSDLHARYTNSYYAVISTEHASFTPATPRDLVPPTLDQLWNSRAPHARAFALLAALRLPDQALLEWQAVKSELSLGDEWSWWKAQAYLWNGDRMSAYRVVRADLGEYIRSTGTRPRAFSAVVYPVEYADWITEYCSLYQLDPYFVCGLICQESHYEREITSNAGAIGLMQLMPATARIQAKKIDIPFRTDDLYDAESNLRIGIAHIAELFQEFSGDSVLVLAAYNAGKSAAQAWFEEFGDSDPDVFVEKIPYRETRLFVKRIFEHIAAYRRLYPDLAQAGDGKLTVEPKP